MSPWLNLIVNVGIFDIMLNDNRFKLPHCMLYMLMPITHWLFEIQWKTQINKIFVREILFMVRHTVINIHIYCDAKLIFFLRIYSWTNAKYLWSLVKTIGWMSDKIKIIEWGQHKSREKCENVLVLKTNRLTANYNGISTPIFILSYRMCVNIDPSHSTLIRWCRRRCIAAVVTHFTAPTYSHCHFW